MKYLRTKLPPPNNLIVFEAAARHLSFTLAAAELGVTQGAVSRQIQAIEAHLGTLLFRRLHSKLQLTPEGRRLHEVVTESLEHIAEIACEIRSARGDPHLTVSASVALMRFWLMPRVAEFRSMFPAVDLRLVASDHDLDLDAEDIDIAVRFGNGRWPNVESTFLLKEEVFPVCSPDYLAGRRSLHTPADLLSETLLEPDDSHPEWVNHWPAWLRANGIASPTILHRIRFNNYSILVEAALKGQGIALGSRHLVDELVANGSLIRPILTTYHPSCGYFLVVSTNMPMRSETSAFRDWILRIAARQQSTGKLGAHSTSAKGSAGHKKRLAIPDSSSFKSTLSDGGKGRKSA